MSTELPISVSPETEIRFLPFHIQNQLAITLETNEAWKKLMGAIPSSWNNPERKKYSVLHISMIEEEAKKREKYGFEILIDEWGTSGKREERPRLRNLLELLIEIENFQAADYLSNDVLKTGPAPRPSHGPSARETELMTEVLRVISERQEHVSLGASQVTNPSVLPQQHVKINSELPNIPFCYLRYITDDFNSAPLTENGRILGSGSFGMVFLGGLPDASPEDPNAICIYRELNLPLKSLVAVKKLHSEEHLKQKLMLDDGDHNLNETFRKEVELMSIVSHDNLLKLLAYSDDSPDCCMVFPFMSNGSLDIRLACENGTPPLQWNQRLDIALGVASGLDHLHSFYNKPLVHRDVKSANVLLDDEMRPKLGDFGLVEFVSSSIKDYMKTSKMMGTLAYMAPEALRGEVSPKMDTFAYGVILLELLTGLPPVFKDDKYSRNIAVYVLEDAIEESIEFIQLLDSKVPPLPEEMVWKLEAIAKACLAQTKKDRPNMRQVCDDLRLVGRENLDETS